MKAQFNETLFFTATNLNWMPLLESKTNKTYILDCLNYLTKNDKCRIYAFVIMPNHIHLVLDLISIDKPTFQRIFLSYTANQCIKGRPVIHRPKARDASPGRSLRQRNSVLQHQAFS